jgi:hypothetical protein
VRLILITGVGGGRGERGGGAGDKGQVFPAREHAKHPARSSDKELEKAKYCM